MSHKSDKRAMREGDPIMTYIADNSLRLHDAQKRLIEVTQGHQWARMMGSPDQLQLLSNLCKLINAKRTLDIGVFTGYSAMSIALALPEDGTVVACDVNDDYASIGKPVWKEAGVYDKIDLRIAPAAQTLEKLVSEGQSGSFDFAFIDANKDQYDQYYELCLKLIRPGGIISFDNMLMGGRVADPDTTDEGAKALQVFNRKLHTDMRVDLSFLRLGDGTTLAFKK